jgi:hypothetical protein
VSLRATRLSNATHHSRTDPEARLARKSSGATAKMNYIGHALRENRPALLVDVEFTEANGTAALAMLARRRQRRGARSGWALGGDRDTTPATSSRVCAPSVSPRMLPRTRQTGAPPSTDASALTTATPLVNASASVSKRSSGG